MARNSYGIAKRSIWYVLRTLIITAAIVALCLGVFIEGLHISNLYILVTEGMEKRAEAILKYGQTGVDIDLTPYFSEEYLNNDHELDSGKYARLAAINAASDDTEGTAPAELPEWEAGRYQVVFKREGSRWYINSITLLQRDPETEVKPTPDMSLLKDKAE